MKSTGKPNLRDLKMEETRIALVEAAVHLFETQGFDQTTVDDIVSRVRVSPSTFFRYFGSKEDVVFADTVSRMTRVEAALQAPTAVDDPLSAAQRAITEETVGLVGMLPELEARCIKLWFAEPALQRRHLEHILRVEDAVSDLLARAWGIDPASDPRGRIAAAAMVGIARAAVGIDTLNAETARKSIEDGFARLRRGLEFLSPDKD